MLEHLIATGLSAGLVVNVWTCQAALAMSAGDNNVSYLADDSYTDALQEELLDVIDFYGGGINMSGRYYITTGMIESGRYPEIARAVLNGAWEPA